MVTSAARSVQRPALGAVAILALTLVATVVAVVASAPVDRVGQVLYGGWILTLATVGALVAARRPRHPVGWLLLATAGLAQIADAAGPLAANRLPDTGAVTQALAWLSHWPAIPAFGLLVFVFLLFPTGRFISGAWRALGVAAGVTLLVMSAAIALEPATIDRVGIANPLGVPALAGVLPTVTLIGEGLSAAFALVALASLLVRLRRARGAERQQLKWVVYAATLMLLTLLFAAVSPAVTNELSFVLAVLGLVSVPVAIGVAILRHQLFDIDVVINRTLVYGGATLAVTALYVVTVVVLGAIFQRAAGIGATVAATVLVAIAFQPLRARLQRVVDRLTFGERRDRYAAVAALGRRLEETIPAEQLAETVATTLAEALALPYVALAVRTSDGEARTLAERGRPTSGATELPVMFGGAVVGVLRYDDRGARLRAGDRELLGDLARQAAPVLHGLQLSEELRRSHEDLVVAREEERRRLRADLHDGLGPQLAGLALGLDAASNLLARDPQAAGEAIAGLGSRAREAIEAVRATTRGLRPAALDDLGLARAVTEKARAFEAPDRRVVIEISDDLGLLSAAAEAAAFHLALEGLTNAVRHGQPRTVRVRIDRDDSSLCIEVSDDGKGLPATPVAGVGLASMRARAIELGGTFLIAPGPHGGTRLTARIPCAP